MNISEAMENFTATTAASASSADTEGMKSKEGHVVNPFASSRDPLPYDPMLGWYTAATLSGLLLLFLACVGLEKVKDKLLMTFEKEHPPPLYRSGGEASSLPGGSEGDQRLGRYPADEPKGSAENDSLLGTGARNCIDHNYVYLTLDRINHVDSTQPGSPSHPTQQPPVTDQGHADQRDWESPVGAAVVPDHNGARTNSLPTIQTHNVKIEIVDVHSDSPVHEMAIIEERDVNESAV